MTAGSLTVPLFAPGTEFLPRLNQVDLSVSKSFKIGGMRRQGQVDLFNKNTDLSYRSVNATTSTYLVPAGVLQGRQTRLGLHMKW